jgi:DNA-binding transcriptional ArsR family regulator
MSLAHPLPIPLVEQIASRFRALGEPMRIRLVDRLRDGESSVQELTDALGTTQQNVSRHLGVLHAAGVLSRRREGTRTMYAIADGTVLDLCETVCGGLRNQVAELDELLAEATRP